MDLQKIPTDAGESAPDPIRRLPMGRGFGWLQDAWALFAAQPGAWIGASLLYLLILMVVGLVPLVGSFATIVLNPMLFAGLMIGAALQDGGERFRVGHLFAGFERAAGPLAAAGGLYLVATFGVTLLLILVAMAILVPLGIGGGLLDGTVSPEAMLADPTVMTVGLALLALAMLLFTLLAMAMLFVPALVGRDGMPVLDSFRLSLLGCLRNLLPLTLFGLILLLIGVASAILTALLPLIVILLVLAGFLVFMPLTMLALYVAYRDIYLP